MIKKIIAGGVFIACMTSAHADVMSTFVVPKIAGAAVEALAKVFDTIITLNTAEQKEWNKYMLEQQNSIRREYLSDRKNAIATSQACVGETPTEDQVVSCGHQFSQNVQQVKLEHKERIKTLQEENKAHRERLIKKRILVNQINSILPSDTEEYRSQ